MYSLCRLSVSQLLARGIDGIRHGEIAERDIGTSHIKVAVVVPADEEFFVQSVVDRDSKAPTNKYFTAFPQNVICTDASPTPHVQMAKQSSLPPAM